MNITNSIYYVPYLKLLKNNISFSDYSKEKNYYTQLSPLFDAMNSRTDFTQKEVDFLISTTKKFVGTKQPSFLDIACGTGRHLKGISEKGYSGIGVDASRSLLEIAQKTTPGVEFHEADMRFFKINNPVDCAYSLWDSYVYLSRAEDMAAFAQQCSAHIKKGGILILDSKNYQKQQLHEEVVHRTNQFDNIRVDTIVRRNTYHHDKVYEAIFTSIIQDTDTDEASVVVDQTLARMYDITELEKILDPYDLKLIKCYGDFDKSDYNSNASNRMVAIFQRR